MSGHEPLCDTPLMYTCSGQIGLVAVIIFCEVVLRVSRLRVEWNLRDAYLYGRRRMNVNKRDTEN